ncbi:sensor histidine kinase [Sphaerisporangium fuscum]|uniref:sensor histidine kinase n=1 Tax=Sphaerisporangium fuscum TaxID=2835868 RepID=UPI002542B5FA|nr:sensor histidine kinase [Sphaerisporangium fuscum]
MGPDEAADPGGLRTRWVLLGLAYALLAVSTLAAFVQGSGAAGVAVLVALSAAAERAHGDAERWGRHMAQVRSLARQSLTEARRSVRALRPEPLEHSHLPDALAEMTRRWAEGSPVTPAVEVTGTPRPLAGAVETTLFRVAQEALANVAKHSGARHVWVTLSYLDDVVLLDVRDDGTGFDPSSADGSRPAVRAGEGGYGVGTMRQRLRGVGGSLEIESSPGQGTVVAALVPALPAPDPVEPM